jgi:hypothetical protein
MKIISTIMLVSVLTAGMIHMTIFVMAQDTDQLPGAPQMGNSLVVHSATLKWYASNQTVNYRVWRAPTLTGTFREIANSITVLTYKDSTVVGGQTYYYKVDARNPKTNLVSGFSNTVRAAIP